MMAFLSEYLKWFVMLFLVGMLGGCSWHVKGVTQGTRSVKVGMRLDNMLVIETTAEGDGATNEETSGFVWTGFGPPVP